MTFNRRHFLLTSSLFAAGATVSNAPFSWAAGAHDAESLRRRTKYLEELRKTLPYAYTWEQWLEKSKELPPDFESMPSNPFLPDPLIVKGLQGGSPIVNRAAWNDQRKWIQSQLEHWVFGQMPPAPQNLRSRVTDTRKEGDVVVQDVLLEFGPQRRATLRLQILTPPGPGPFPVLVTTHSRMRPWVNVALRRGYMGCISYAADKIYVDEDDSKKWNEIYSDYDFPVIARWAWGAMRAVDHLYTLPTVDRNRIAISGHSRNAKLSLLAAAFDERFAAVIPSRGNTLSEIPLRYSTGMFANETIEMISRWDWCSPRLRFLVGREHKLPVDMHMLLALVAPRGLLISHAYTENQGNPWAIEQAYRSVERVYRLLNAEENLGLYQQAGEHPSSPEDFERYVDFLDRVFGRADFARRTDWVNGYTFQEWQRESKIHVDPGTFPIRKTGDFVARGSEGSINNLEGWHAEAEEIRERIRWVLGEEPPGVPFPARETFRGPSHLRGRTSEGYLGMMLRRPSSTEQMGVSSISFGDDLKARLYYPRSKQAAVRSERAESGAGPTGGTSSSSEEDSGGMPAVVWLHAHCYAIGYSPQTEQWLFNDFVENGFVVLTFDQIGFGSRVEQVKQFYRRYPDWSLLGKMVTDTRAAIDILAPLRFVDPARIYLAGSSLGAKIALFTAALDNRAAGAAAVCGFAPWRLDSPAKGTEGVRHYSHLHGLLPRLGFFVGNERRLPIDYDEILAAIAPRPVHIVAPTLDRYAPVDDVIAAVEAARNGYRLFGREENLTIETPLGFHGLVEEWVRQKKLVQWVATTAGVRE